ncbi:MAG: redoxin domain-containing protein [Candidatus Brocadiaceae bacterium]|nr:redoxin domain-containing protein [Candidatus Brocadiaceae bacterium]
MNFRFSSILIFIILSFVCFNNTAWAQKNHILSGTITNIPIGTSKLVYLYLYFGDELSVFTSASIDKQGGFSIELDETLKQGMYKIGFDHVNSANIVLTGEEEIVINADYQKLKDDKILVTNSKENEAYNILINECKQLSGKIVSLNIEKSQISTIDPHFVRKTKILEDKISMLIEGHNVNLLFMKENYPGTFMAEVLISLSFLPRLTDHPELSAGYDNEQAFMHDYFFEFVDFTDKRIIYNPFLAQKYVTYLEQYTHQTLEGLMESVDLILSKTEANNTVREFTLEQLINIFNKRGPAEMAEYVIDDYIDGCTVPISKRMSKKIENVERLRVGHIAPEIVSKDPDGNMIALSDLLKKNKVVMLYFWASWCHVCEEENSNILRLYKKFRDKGFDIYTFAFDSDKAQWLMAINEHQFTWTNVSDLKEWDSDVVGIYNVCGTPTIYILDNKGRILSKNLRGKSLEKKLNELLN